MLIHCTYGQSNLHHAWCAHVTTMHARTWRHPAKFLFILRHFHSSKSSTFCTNQNCLWGSAASGPAIRTGWTSWVGVRFARKRRSNLPQLKSDKHYNKVNEITWHLWCSCKASSNLQLLRHTLQLILKSTVWEIMQVPTNFHHFASRKEWYN